MRGRRTALYDVTHHSRSSRPPIARSTSRIIATLTIKKAADNQRVDVGLANLDQVAPEAALSALAQTPI
jgi:hypothetical protein